MELPIVVQPPVGPARAVVVDVDHGGTVRHLAASLAGHLELDHVPALARRDGPLSEYAPMGLVLPGDVLFLDRPPEPAPDETPVADLDVVAGPDAGRRFPLVAGCHRVGRDPAATATLTDPLVSTHHLELAVTRDGATVRDVGSTNGAALDGEPLCTRARWPDDTIVRIGNTLLQVQRREGDAQWEPDGRGAVVINRPPRRPGPPVPAVPSLPAPPSEPRRARVSLATIIAPLLIGVAAWLITHNPIMLMFLALSPVIAGWSLLEERRHGGKSWRKERAAYLALVAEAAALLQEARRYELRTRRRAAPHAAEIMRRATQRCTSLWERRPFEDDFLHLRVGHGEAAVQATATIEPGGSDRLHAEALEALEVAPLIDVPFTIDLAALGAVGIAGAAQSRTALARWLVVQLATLHSHRDIAVLGAIDDAGAWEWLSWLPHRDAVSIGGDPIVVGSVAGDELVQRLLALIRARQSERQALSALDAAPPTVVVVLDESAVRDGAGVAQMLREGPGVGVNTLWLSARPHNVPGECRAVLEINDTALRLTTDAGEVQCVGEGLDAELASRAARALAPVRDAGAATGTARLPRSVGLLECLGLTHVDGEFVQQRWGAGEGTLRATLGMGVDGPVVIDLRSDGPHSLVAGTTGAGKSELLQTLVATMALDQSPARCTFVLIDYKGGAAFSHCARLPHTVGLVTDLDGRLAQRVLSSLRAEIRRREAILRAAGARDLAELESRDPSAPPCLVIVIDEFAALAREVPEFVDGVIDLAQRGRSLGLHVILATQRPAGVVSENIRGNTNLRIALRVNDVNDSRDVIDADDAARIPRALAGRAFARLGHAELTAVQVAHAGGATIASTTGTGKVRDRVLGAVPSKAVPATLETDLEVLVGAIAAAWKGNAAPRRPWIPPLPTAVSLDELTRDLQPNALVLGLLDEPDAQSQRSWHFSLDAGSMAVFGATGSGRTTVLRSAAVAFARSGAPRAVVIYGIDFASRGLQPLESLPHCGAVVHPGDLARVTRLLRRLEQWMTERAQLLMDAGVSCLDELPVTDTPKPPRVLVVVDGYSAFHSTFERVDLGSWIDRLHRVIADGRPLGMHIIVTADRRSAIPAAALASIATRLVLRTADQDEAVALGVPAPLARSAELPAGRGVVDGREVQVGIVGADPSGASQARAIVDLGATLRRRYHERAAPVTPLPAVVIADDLPVPTDALCPYLGLDDAGPAPFAINLRRHHFAVLGPPGSGRTTTLATIAHGLARHPSPVRVIAIDPDQRLPEVGTNDTATVVCIDDAARFVDDPQLEALAEMTNVRLVIAAEAHHLARAYSGGLAVLRRSRRGLLLVPDLETDGDAFGVRLRTTPGMTFPAGRGFHVERGRAEVVQVASLPVTMA